MSGGFIVFAGLLAFAQVDVVERFRQTGVFWRQLEVAKEIVALGDARVMPQLESWLMHVDRHRRANTAFIFAALDDERGWRTLESILTDWSDRPEGQGIPAGRFSAAAQIRADRYYAVHVIGELRRVRGLALLAPLLDDPAVNYKAVWALGEIGGPQAVELLIRALDDPSADVCVIAVQSLERLHARDALPRLRTLRGDDRRTRFGTPTSVSDAVKAAIATLERQ